jgi:hypothetical protein
MARRFTTPSGAGAEWMSADSPFHWFTAFGVGVVSLLAFGIVLFRDLAHHRAIGAPPPSIPARYGYLLDDAPVDGVVLVKVGDCDDGDATGRFAVAVYRDGSARMDGALANGIAGRHRGAVAPEVLARLDELLPQRFLDEYPCKVEPVFSGGAGCYVAVKRGSTVDVFLCYDPPQFSDLARVVACLDGLRDTVEWSRE